MTQTHPVEHDAAADSPVGSVTAPLTYTIKKAEKLVYLITGMGEEEDEDEYREWYSSHEMQVNDVRPVMSSLTLDHEGFILKQAETSVTDFYDNSEVEGVYNAEVEKLVMETTGASKVLIFDHTIRVGSDDMRRERKVREVVDLVHNDYTVDSGPQRVRELLDEDEATQRLKHRFAVYNLWRSIAGTVLSKPLAICDAQSVNDDDWVPCNLDYGDRMGEIYNVAFNADHRWCYFPNMGADEVLIFKNYDSAEDGRARFTPHTAFTDPTSDSDAPTRESIETRVLAFFDEVTD